MVETESLEQIERWQSGHWHARLRRWCACSVPARTGWQLPALSAHEHCGDGSPDARQVRAKLGFGLFAKFA